jgi:hypothetical protein
LEVEVEGVIGIDHSSSLASGDEALEEDTSPRRDGFLRVRFAGDFDEEEGDIMVCDSGRAGGRPTAREGEEGCRERVRCLLGERMTAMRRGMMSESRR